METPSIGGTFTLHEHASEVTPRDAAPHARLHDACSLLGTACAPPTQRSDQQVVPMMNPPGHWAAVPTMMPPGTRALQHSLHCCLTVRLLVTIPIVSQPGMFWAVPIMRPPGNLARSSC